MEEREKTIETLSASLSEANEQIEITNKDIEIHQLEKKRLLSVSSLQGETYDSVGQQMRAIQSERMEIQRQLETYRGQLDLANETITRVRVLLDEQRVVNNDLRKRQGLATLVKEKQAAIEMSESERQKRIEMQDEIEVLQNNLREMKGELASVQTAAGAAIELAEIEKRKREELQSEIEAREMDRAPVSDEAPAAGNENGESEVFTPPSGPDTPGAQGYFRQSSARGYSDLGINGLTGGAVGSVGIPAVSSPSRLNSPRSPTTSANLNARSPTSPGWQAESTFRTIHGQHRADGSLDGYRSDRGMRRLTSDSLYDVSIRNGSVEGLDSVGSEGRTTTGSNGAS